MASPQKFSTCCVKHFTWEGTPSGRVEELAGNPTYIAGSNTGTAVLFVHDALGWKFTNARLLADHFAKEANVTVYMPDFFGGEVLDPVALKEGRWADLDMAGFKMRNAREIREPEIFACAKALREQGVKKLGAIGYCYGGWAVMRLAAKEHQPPLVDCIVAGHPSWVTKEDIDGVGSVPVQFLAPEKDGQFPDEMKLYAFQKLILERKSLEGGIGVAVDFVHFPGAQHGCLTKGDENTPGERAAMVQGKDAAVSWFRQWLS